MLQIRHLLDNIQFTGCSYNGAALTHGLLEAMYLQSLPTALPMPPDQGQGQGHRQGDAGRDVIDLTDQHTPLDGTGPGSGAGAQGGKLPPPPLCHCLLVAPFDAHRMPVAQLVSRSNGSWRRVPEGAAPRREQCWETIDVALCFRDQCNMSLSVLGFKDRHSMLLQVGTGGECCEDDHCCRFVVQGSNPKPPLCKLGTSLTQH